MTPALKPQSGALLLLCDLHDDDDVMLMIRPRPGMSWMQLIKYGLTRRAANDAGRPA